MRPKDAVAWTSYILLLANFFPPMVQSCAPLFGNLFCLHILTVQQIIQSFQVFNRKGKKTEKSKNTFKFGLLCFRCSWRERSCFLLSIALLLLQYSSIGTGAAKTNITIDQSALLAMRSHITSDPHNILVNWSTSTSLCNWVGVTCGARRHLRVVSLNLSYMVFTGTIPPHLGNLSFLVALSFNNNSFYGTLPHELSYLRRLKFISLRFNNFMGSIPSWFGSFPKLQRLDLYGNQFLGTIPLTIFNLSTLQDINLSSNKLLGAIPKEIGNLTTLKKIYLDSNHFNEIPKEIGFLDQVEKFYVQFNALKGPVPMTVFNMSSLITLTLYGNSLCGGLPDNICQHLPSLQTLNLGRNQFDGPLPSKLWQCTELLNLILEKNNFSRSIPKTIGNLTQLALLAFETNNLTGVIPREIGNLTMLKEINLRNNNLTGLVLVVVFNVSSLTTLTLYGNNLSGGLPDNICQDLHSLQTLDLGRNAKSFLYFIWGKTISVEAYQKILGT
ncbi:unnamed protein product [Prunus armeniaca]